MFKNLFKKQRQTVKASNMLVLSPVYSTKITGAVYQVGELIPHARMTAIYEDTDLIYGTCYDKNETRYFVATDSEVVDHIRHQGAVPLAQSRFLRIFSEKKKMQAYVKKVQFNPKSA